MAVRPSPRKAREVMSRCRQCIRVTPVVLAVLVSLTAAIAAAAAGKIPNRFVYLRDADATILQDMRYGSANNFTGHRVPGYDAPECVLVREAADALKAVQAELRPRGLSLKVYDCYRLARAVAAFVAWAKLPDDLRAKATYYPALDKRALEPFSRDLTLVPLDARPAAAASEGWAAAPCTAPQDRRMPDSGLDMERPLTAST
jgi:D-alanyl-D-alanine dipeptidase